MKRNSPRRPAEHVLRAVGGRWWVSSLVWGGVATLLLTTPVYAAAEPRPYAIFAQRMSCERAHQLATQVVERLGYTVTTPSPATSTGEGEIKGARKGTRGEETVTVKMTCGSDGVHVDANPDIPPCEQANQIAYHTVERSGYTVATFVPAVTGKKAGLVKGKHEGTGETVTLTISCTAEAVYIDTRSDSPLVASGDLTTAITDFRRGFFSLFKPLADAERGQPRP